MTPREEIRGEGGDGLGEGLKGKRGFCAHKEEAHRPWE